MKHFIIRTECISDDDCAFIEDGNGICHFGDCLTLCNQNSDCLSNMTCLDRYYCNTPSSIRRSYALMLQGRPHRERARPQRPQDQARREGGRVRRLVLKVQADGAVHPGDEQRDM